MLLESARAFSEHGWRVVVVLPTDGPLVGALQQQAAAEVLRMPVPVLRKALLRPRGVLTYAEQTLRALPRMLHLLRQVGPDVVYVSTSTLPVWLAAARAVRVAVVCHVHEAAQPVPVVVRRALAAPLWLAHVVIANSGATQEEVLKQFPRLRSRTVVLHNGVPGPRDTTPTRVGLDPPVRLVLVGRVSWVKGTDLAVAALARLVERGHDVVLDLVGGVFEGYEWFERQVRQQVEREGLGERVSWRGVAPQPWTALDSSDIALVPSRLESFGNSAAEALLAGRPVVATRVQGLCEVVEPGRDGELVEPEDAHALAAGVERVMADWSSARRRAAEARQRAAARFSPERYRADVVRLVSDRVRPTMHRL